MLIQIWQWQPCSWITWEGWMGLSLCGSPISSSHERLVKVWNLNHILPHPLFSFHHQTNTTMNFPNSKPAKILLTFLISSHLFSITTPTKHNHPNAISNNHKNKINQLHTNPNFPQTTPTDSLSLSIPKWTSPTRRDNSSWRPTTTSASTWASPSFLGPTSWPNTRPNGPLPVIWSTPVVPTARTFSGDLEMSGPLRMWSSYGSRNTGIFGNLLSKILNKIETLVLH